MFQSKVTVEQRLEKAVVTIMGVPQYRALAGILMVGKRTVVDDLPTACTNGRDEMYGRAFVESLSDAELRYVVLHENYHKMYRHLITWRALFKQDADCANRAADYMINALLEKDIAAGLPIKRPRMALYDAQYDGMNTPAIFNLLRKNPPPPSNGAGNGAGSGFDEHDWDGAADMPSEERDALAREIDAAVRQGALAASATGTGGNRAVEELLKPKVDWRAALRDFVTARCTGRDYSTYARPNRRYQHAGIYMPTSFSETIGDIVVGNDMSGSIDARGVAASLAETVSICETVRPARLHMLYWDTAVCRAEVYGPGEYATLLENTRPTGGGGTDVRCVPQYLREHAIKPQAAIIITDGCLYGGWGDWDVPVLWCIVDNPNAQPTVGTCVHVDSYA